MDQYTVALDDIIRDCMRLRMRLRTATEGNFSALLTAHYAVEKIKNDIEDMSDRLLAAANRSLDDDAKKLNSATPLVKSTIHDVHLVGTCDPLPYTEPSFD